MDTLSKKTKMRRMKRRLAASLLTFFVVALMPRGDREVLASAEQPECSALMQFTMADVKVTEAVVMPAPSTGIVRVAHCKVNGVIGKEIHFTLILPDTWNHKFLMGGGGGFVEG